jgi:hypothetical protein
VLLVLVPEIVELRFKLFLLEHVSHELVEDVEVFCDLGPGDP